MSAHNLPDKARAAKFPTPSAVPVKVINVPAGAALAYGTTVPVDTTAGYVPGAIFLHTDGAAKTMVYVNNGSAASSLFAAVGDLTTLAATTNGNGAALVGIEDALAVITATTVEGALAELAKRGIHTDIADPGTGVAIPVTKGGTVNLTIGSSGAETNTLAIPGFAGQELAIIASTVGTGTRAITAASAINQTGNTVMTFAQANDLIVLKAVKVGAALAWRVALNDGVALS